ncbi:MAG: CsbD family protein [Actinomycetota bacterium]
MGEKTDEAKGRVKEAAGDLTDDDDLKREGKMDQVGATVKRKTGEAVDKTKEVIDDLTDGDDRS